MKAKLKNFFIECLHSYFRTFENLPKNSHFPM